MLFDAHDEFLLHVLLCDPEDIIHVFSIHLAQFFPVNLLNFGDFNKISQANLP